MKRAVAEQKEGVMGPLERIVKIFSSPREVFVYLKEKPDWLLPAIILAIVMVLSVALLFEPVLKQEQMKRFEESSQAGQMTPEQMEEARKRFEGGLGLIMSLVGAFVVNVVVFLLLVSGVLYGIFSLMGGDGKFKQVFSVVSYSSLVGVAATIIRVALMLARGSAEVYTSAALAVPGLATESTLFRLLNSFDIFTIWHVWLVIIGLAIVCGFTTKKAATGVLSLWGLWIVVKVVAGMFIGS